MDINKELILKILQSIIDKYDLEEYEILTMQIAIDCIDKNEEDKSE